MAPPALQDPFNLVDDPEAWARQRIAAELRLAIQARQRVQKYKGGQWKAEFMRWMYPACRTRSAKGFSDLIRRLTKAPWGAPDWSDDPELSSLLKLLGKDK